MPDEKYKKPSNLPERVKDNLPFHAEEIYQKAHDAAIEEYKDPDKRRGRESQDVIAHKVAWAAVKKKYQKKDGEWKEKKK